MKCPNILLAAITSPTLPIPKTIGREKPALDYASSAPLIVRSFLLFECALPSTGYISGSVQLFLALKKKRKYWVIKKKEYLGLD